MNVRKRRLLAVSTNGRLAEKTLAKDRESGAEGLAAGASAQLAEVVSRLGLLRDLEEQLAKRAQDRRYGPI